MTPRAVRVPAARAGGTIRRSLRVFLLGVLCTCPSLGSGATASAEPRGGDALRIAVTYLPASRDPARLVAGAGEHIARACYEGLVRLDPETLRPVPGMAASWSTSEDGLTWTFALRKAACWSDGRRVTAQDVAASLRRAFSPACHALIADVLRALRGAPRSGEEPDEAFGRTRGVVALDADTLRIDLERPVPWLLDLLVLASASPLPEEDRGVPCNEAEPGTSRWLDVEGRVNGPYKPVALEPGGGEAGTLRSLTLERNEAYWDAGNVRQERVQFLGIEDRHQGLKAFTQGDVDWTTSWPMELTSKLEGSDVLRVTPANMVYYYGLNTRHPALRDARVRRALAKAVDRKALVRETDGLPQRIARSFVPDSLPGYEPPTSPLAFDPEAARALLAEAGHPNGKGLPALDLLYNMSRSHRAIARHVAAGWRRELGIEVRLHHHEWLRYRVLRGEGDYAVVRAGWIADYPEPTSFLELFASGHPENHGGWSDADYDALLGRIRQTPDRAARLRLGAQAERLLLVDAPLIPLYWYTWHDLVHPHVRGFRTHARDGTPNGAVWHPLRGLWIERER